MLWKAVRPSGNPESPSYTQGCAQAHRGHLLCEDGRRFTLSHLAATEALCREGEGAEAELWASWLPGHKHRALSKDRQTYELREFREICVQSLAGHSTSQAKTSVMTHGKAHRLLVQERDLNTHTRTHTPQWQHNEQQQS